MPLHDLIFSNKVGKRLQRHLLFWLTWWLYFSFCEYLYQLPLPGRLRPFYLNVGSPLLLKTFLLITVYSVACYAILYILLPLIIKKDWLRSGLLLLSVGGFLYIMTFFLFWNVFRYIDSLFGLSGTTNHGTKLWPAFNLGLIAPLKIIASAVIIKYLKNWWLKQKEIERLEQEKISAELQLLKAQVHPDFLFKTLNNTRTHALSSSPRATSMLLKLSDLLSYMLYECDRPQVPLEKEIEMMKEYMQLEKISRNDEPEMEVNIKGEMSGKFIAPFLLLPFIENSFQHSSQMTEQAWINMDIRVEGDCFSMKLTNGVSEEFREQTYNYNGLSNVQKRLILLYPGKHELRITSEQEMLIVLLNIKLEKASMIVLEEEADPFAIENEKSNEPA
jgi:two-component system LytT family sensor kinase